MASVRKREWTHNGTKRFAWAVSYTDLSGKRPQEQFRTKKEADARREEIEAELKSGVHVSASNSITINQATDEYLAHCNWRHRSGTDDEKMSRNTLECYQIIANKHIRPFLGLQTLGRLTSPAVQKWADSLRKNPAAPRGRATMEKATNILQQIIDHAMRGGKVNRNIVKQCPPKGCRRSKKSIEFPSRDHVKTMLREADGMMRVVVHLAVFAGMRRGEIFGLTWNRIDFQGRQIIVRQSMNRWGELVPPKTEAGNREIQIGDAMLTMLKEHWLASGRPDAGMVFKESSGGRVRYPQFWEQWCGFLVSLRLVDEIGEPLYHFHAMRHVAASLFIEEGLPIKQVQRLMGHASAVMTLDLYGKLFDDQQAPHAAVAGIENTMLG